MVYALATEDRAPDSDLNVHFYLMLESELGYEWLMQDFGREDFEVQQAFGVFALRRRF